MTLSSATICPASRPATSTAGAWGSPGAAGQQPRRGALKLAAIPAGESPANRGVNHCCSHIQRREGRPIRRKPGSKSPLGKETGQILRGSATLQAVAAANPRSRENRASRETDCGIIGSAEPFGPWRRPMSISVFWTETMIELPEVREGVLWIGAACAYRVGLRSSPRRNASSDESPLRRSLRRHDRRSSCLDGEIFDRVYSLADVKSPAHTRHLDKIGQPLACVERERIGAALHRPAAFGPLGVEARGPAPLCLRLLGGVHSSSRRFRYARQICRRRAGFVDFAQVVSKPCCRPCQTGRAALVAQSRRRLSCD